MTPLHTQYSIDPNEWSDQTGLSCNDPSLAQQQFKDECDINILMGRYLETGVIPQVEATATYGDFTGIFDFQTAKNAVIAAEHMFTELPARIKNRFDNNPGKMLNFLENPDNREEAEFLGLLTQRKTHELNTDTTPPSGAQKTPLPSGTTSNPQPPPQVQST